MRQLKYFVNGAKGKIEVTKGTFLSLERRRNKKVSKKKIIFQTKGPNKNKKLIVKQIKSNIKITNKKPKNYPSKLQKEDQKSCPDTIESNKNTTLEDPMVSQFQLFQENFDFQDKTKQIINLENFQIQLKQYKLNQPTKTQFSEPSEANLYKNHTIYDDEFENEMELDQCEQSTWSMINQHVQFMTMSLNLSFYDHVYGQRKEV